MELIDKALTSKSTHPNLPSKGRNSPNLAPASLRDGGESCRDSSPLNYSRVQNDDKLVGLLHTKIIYPRNDAKPVVSPTSPKHLPCSHSEGVSTMHLYNFCKNFLFTIHSSLFTNFRDSSPLNYCRVQNDDKFVGLLTGVPSLRGARATWQSSKLLLGFTQPTFFDCRICFGLLRATLAAPSQ